MFYVSVCFDCTYQCLCSMYMPGAQGSQKAALDSQEQGGPHKGLSLHSGAGNQTQGLWRQPASL